ncbi:MAG: hypothetical protein AB1726_15665 [Planctomycetota bacterium]
MRPRRPSSPGVAVLAALAVLLLAPAEPAAMQESGEPAPLAGGIPRLESAAAQLAYARGLKGAIAAGEGEERERRTRLAVAAFRAVYELHPAAKELGAEAAFRAGELLRAAERSSAALVEFERAASRGGGTAFRARAGLEIGHVHRREGRPARALEAYLAVAADSDADPEHQDDAWLWAGTVWRDRGRVAEARRAWRSVAEGARSPLDRIRAFDLLAETWIDAGDLEAAAGALDECRRALAPLALEETRTGDEVRQALQRMHTVSALPRAIAERDAARRRGDVRSRSRHGTPRIP